MRIEQMANFVKATQYESLTKASKVMFFTAQALSNSISKMEQELGVKLITRSQTGIELTEEGSIFRETAMRILQEYSLGLERLRRGTGADDKRSLSGILKIYCNPVSQQTFLPSLLAKFGERYPNYTMEVITSSRHDTCRFVRDAREDDAIEAVGFIGQLYRHGSLIGFETDLDGLNLYPVLTSQLIACVSENSPLALQKKVSLKTVSAYPLVLFTVNGLTDYEKLFQEYGHLRIALMTDSFPTWLQAAEDSHTVALIQESMLETHLHHIASGFQSQIVPMELAGEILAQVCLVTNEKLSPVVSDLQAFLQGSVLLL